MNVVSTQPFDNISEKKGKCRIERDLVLRKQSGIRNEEDASPLVRD